MGLADRKGVIHGSSALRAASADSSPLVRIVADQALVTYGTESGHSAAYATPREIPPIEKSGVLVAMSALRAIDAFGIQADSLHELVAP